MKKTLFVTALLCAALSAVSAQNRLPDLEAYFAAANQLDSPKWDFENRPFRGEEATDTARFGNLTGNLNYIDSYLEFALLTYYSAAEKPWAERGSAILPLNNPRLVDRQLGAMVVKELAEIKFLDPQNTAAIGRYESMIAYICGRNGVSRAEMQDYLKQGIAAVVDAEFNKVSFLIDRTNTAGSSYNAVLTRNKQNKYVLSYEGYFNGTKLTKELSPVSSLEALYAEMGRNKDFIQDDIRQVRAQAALIPATKLKKEALDGIKEILVNLYTHPTDPVAYATVNAVLALYMKYINLRSDNVLNEVYSSYERTLISLNPKLSEKVGDDHRRSPSTNVLTREQQQALTGLR
jgi:hypothetical protein